jgi:hypothetical protein
MTDPQNLADRLAAMQDSWDEASTERPAPPDGRYQALVEGFDTFESKAGQLFLKTKLQLTGTGDRWDGETVECVHNLEDAERIGFAKKHLATLGLDVQSLDLASLLDQLEQVLDVPVEVQVKRSDRTDDEGNPYVNYYVNKRLGDALPTTDVPADPIEPAPVGDDDDIPF